MTLMTLPDDRAAARLLLIPARLLCDLRNRLQLSLTFQHQLIVNLLLYIMSSMGNAYTEKRMVQLRLT